MSYLSDVADEIRRGAASRPGAVGRRRRSHAAACAVLALAVGQAVTAENVHDAWTAWMTARGQEHDSMVPFGKLAPDVQLEDEPFVLAIRRVADRLGGTGRWAC
ncbi:MAG: hypothetical protein M5U19_05590 [Microthrixaceae bacterium]|nr:hypothetical protein [Microthrixaceae bacterium]